MGIVGATKNSNSDQGGDTDSGNTSSNSSSSSGGRSGKRAPANPAPDDFPIYRVEKPEVLIYEDTDTGEVKAKTYPNTPEVELEKEWYSDNWTTVTPSSHWIRWWFGKSSLRRLSRQVEQHSGDNLKQLLREDPEYALKAIRASANPEAVDKDWYKDDCPVCGDTIHARYDEHEVVDNKRVCKHHSVKELAEADLV